MSFQKIIIICLPVLAVVGWCLQSSRSLQNEEDLQTNRSLVIPTHSERYQVSLKPVNELVAPKFQLDFNEIRLAHVELEQHDKQEVVLIAFDEKSDSETVEDSPSAFNGLAELSGSILAPGTNQKNNRFRLADEVEEIKQKIARTSLNEDSSALQSILTEAPAEPAVTVESNHNADSSNAQYDASRFTPTPELPELPASVRPQETVQETVVASRTPLQPTATALNRPQSWNHSVAMSNGLPPSVAAQIRQRLGYAGSLARRGAFSTAEETYFQVIRLIAETRDSQFGTREHATHLANALTAFEESQDFITTDLQARVRMNVSHVITGHNTKLLHKYNCDTMPAIQALQRYYEYAGEELVLAVGNERMASEALYSLGKLYSMDSQFNPTELVMQNAKSMIVHQSALSADPTNHLAGNELGVLLARYGKLQDARDILLHSVSVSPEIATWKNLAIVHERLGEQRLAALAQKEYQLATTNPRGVNHSEREIQWVDPVAFEKMAGKNGDRAMQGLQQASTTPNTASKTQPAAIRTAQKKRWKLFNR